MKACGRELWFTGLFLYAVFSGAIRKWWEFPDLVDHMLLGAQVLLPWFIALGFLPWKLALSWVPLLLYLALLLSLALFSGTCGYGHGLFGFLLHGGFWVGLWAFHCHRQEVTWRHFHWISLLVLVLETCLSLWQYNSLPTGFWNRYANPGAIGDIALLGERARVTGTFSYVSGFGAYLLFMGFQTWARRKEGKGSLVMDAGQGLCLLLLSLLNGSRAILFGVILLLGAAALSGRGKGIFWIPLMIFPLFWGFLAYPQNAGEIRNHPVWDMMKRIQVNQESGEQTDRLRLPWQKIWHFRTGKHPLGYGLGCTYQGANEVWGKAFEIARFGYYEEEGERILMEGGWVLLLAKVGMVIVFLQTGTLPAGVVVLLFGLQLGYFPVVFNTYNAFFLLWGIGETARVYGLKHRAPDA